MSEETTTEAPSAEGLDHPRLVRPYGYVALCRCGFYTGALDATRTDRKEMASILGEWLINGKTVEPRFDPNWEVALRSCRCGEKSKANAKDLPPAKSTENDQ